MIEVKDKAFYLEHLPDALPVFYEPFFLDVVTGGRWEASCVCDHDKILVCMPYPLLRKKYNIIRQPPFGIYLGPYFVPEYKGELSLSREMELLEALESSLRPNDYYNQNWHPSSRNWLPFFWRGYQQSTRYSYVIPGGRQMEEIRSGYSENVRRNIKKSSGKIRCEESDDVEGFFSVVGKTFERKNIQQPYDLKMFDELIRICRQRRCGSVYLAKAVTGEIHAGLFLIWDDHWVYYIAGGIETGYKSSGAMSLLFDNAISFALQSGRSFDFEGSMIRPVEKFFRSFGAVQQEYFVLTKVRSPFLRARLILARLHPIFAPF